MVEQGGLFPTVLRLTFFPREIADIHPIWSAGQLMTGNKTDIRYVSDFTDMINFAALDQLNEAPDEAPNKPYMRAKTLYQRVAKIAKKKKVDIEQDVVLNMINRGAEKHGPPGILWNSIIMGYTFFAPETYGDGAARDLASGWAAAGLMMDVEIHDLMTVYFPAPDTVAHGLGEAKGLTVLTEVTDPVITLLYEILKFRKWQGAVTFVFTSDHGMSGVNPNPDHVAALHDNDGSADDIADLLKSPPLNLSTYGITEGDPRDQLNPISIKLKQAVYSPNGGMAHVYLRNASNWISRWDPPKDGESTLNFKVAEQLKRASLGDPDKTKDLVFQGGLAKKIKAVVFKANPDFGSRYLSLIQRKDKTYAQVELKDDLPSHWNGPQRLNVELSSVRSGDVLLILYDDDINPNNRAIAWNADEVLYQSFHGSLSSQDSQVPLTFVYPGGGSLKFMKKVVSNAKRISNTEHINGDLTPIVEEIINSTR